MRKRSVLRVASFVATTEFLYCTSPIAARIEISEITIKSSTRVNPFSRANADLPVSVFRAIERLACRFGVHVEHIAASPGRGVRLVPVGSHAPLARMRHRIDGDTAQELELDPRRVVVLRDPFHQRLEARWIALGARFAVEGADRAAVGCVFLLVTC